MEALAHGWSKIGTGYCSSGISEWPVAIKFEEDIFLVRLISATTLNDFEILSLTHPILFAKRTRNSLGFKLEQEKKIISVQSLALCRKSYVLSTGSRRLAHLRSCDLSDPTLAHKGGRHTPYSAY